MESLGGSRFGKLSSSGLPRGRPPKHGHPQEAVKSTAGADNNKHGTLCGESFEGKRKGRPKVDVQELRSIPAHMIVQWKEEFKRRSRVKCPCSGCWLEFPSIYGVKYHYQRCQGAPLSEKMSHSCPYCEAVFATKVRLQKHTLWNHPDRVSVEPKGEQPKLQKTPFKANAKKRPMENSPLSPVFFKVKKTHEASTPSHNGELPPHRGERKPHVHSQAPLPVVHAPQPVLQPQSHHSERSPSTSSDNGGSESEGGSLPPPFLDEDPERMKHKPGRKQKTPKKFTGEQPSISGTFGLKGMTKVEEKLKAGRGKRPEGSGFSEEPQRRPNHSQPTKKDPAPAASGPPYDTQWQHSISERGEVVCPNCSIVTRKTVAGLKKHMEICQKLQDALKCQQCHKQFRSKAGLNYHTMAEHSTKPSGSEGQTRDEQEERDRLRRVLKQMGRIKCPSEGCSAHFSSLMGYQYHQKRCGRDLSEDQKPVFLCQHCGKTYRSKAGRDYHIRTEHPPAAAADSHNNNSANNHDDSTTDTNNNTGKERVIPEETPPAGRKEQAEQREWQEKAVPARHKEEWGSRDAEGARETEPDRAGVAASESLGEDFDRTPSGRVRRRSAQVAVFHLQEIAEDELARDWGTKRRIKDDLVPDSKRLNYTRPGLPNFSSELLETWKNEVKEKGFISCSNGSCEAVYSSVSGLKAHLANCIQGGGEMGKYTCLICQKEFSSESGVKYHISKTHSQNWFRAAASHVVSTSSSNSNSSSKAKPLENSDDVKAEVKNSTALGKKRGRKPKERPPVAEPGEAETPPTPLSSTTPNSMLSPSLDVTHTLTDTPSPTDSESPLDNRQANGYATKRGKSKRLSLE